MLRLVRAGKLLAAAIPACALPALAANHELTINPLPAGRFEVACSNIEQDTSRLVAGSEPADYWAGRVVEGRPRYISELLVHPGSALRVDALVPDLRQLYPGNAGDVVEFTAIVCHPTPRDNPDPDYPLPGTSDVVPHMLPPGAQPKLLTAAEYASAFGLDPSALPPGAVMQLPLIVYSHGLGGSPIGKGYIAVMSQLAAQGYMVAAIFHGDPRFSRVRIEDLSDAFYALTNFDRIVEMMLMRPVSLKAMTDVLLGHAGYAPAVDTERIGGFGASMGGQAMAHLLGARITATLGKSCRETVTDPRIKAAVGYVPYAGQSFLPAFCDDQAGAEGVERPFLAITGSADTTAPEYLAEQAVNRFKGSRYMVSLAGGEHELRAEDAGDIFTWMITFFNAYLDVRADSGAWARWIKMGRVNGGRTDSLVVDVHVPTTFDGSVHQAPVREFYNTDLDHYFLAAWQGEVDIILSGGAGQGWVLTNESFKGYRQLAPALFSAIAPVCRFYGAAAGGPNSHFFTASPDSCEAVKQMGGWFYEGIGFYVLPLTATGRCPAGQFEVMRAYNDRWRQNDSNHRYSTSDSTMREMARRGWIVEGTAWCALP